MGAAQQMMAGYGVAALTYATWNPADKGAGAVLSNGNLSWAESGNNGSSQVRGTISKSSGKWYWETSFSSGAGNVIGIALNTASLTGYASTTGVWGFNQNLGSVSNSGRIINGAQTPYGTTSTSPRIIGCAWDAGAGSLEFFINNVSQGVAVTGIAANTYYPFIGSNNVSETQTTNFGATALTYTPPTGFNAGLYN